jgi:hypothetical protein
MDVYTWEDDGAPPPDNNPGNILNVQVGVSPGPIAMWPEISAHKVNWAFPITLPIFVGFWGNWPMANPGWFIASDETGPGGSPRTKIAPGIGYPTGWNHTNIVPTFSACKSLGICFWWSDKVTPAKETTWGKIKALY